PLFSVRPLDCVMVVFLVRTLENESLPPKSTVNLPVASGMATGPILPSPAPSTDISLFSANVFDDETSCPCCCVPCQLVDTEVDELSVRSTCDGRTRGGLSVDEAYALSIVALGTLYQSWLVLPGYERTLPFS